MKDTDWEIIYELKKLPNITKVANKLYMTQPSLTKRLKCIEEEFHIKVVDRTPKGVVFTPEGIILAKRAERYMKFIRDTKQEMQQYRETLDETILIGAAYSYQREYLNDILYDYSQTHPHVNLEICNDSSNILFRRVCEGDLDMAFIQGDYEGPVYKKTVAIYKAYVLSKDPVTLAELPNLQRIEYKSNDKSKELLDAWWLERYNSEPDVAVSVTYIDFAWKLVEKGLGYALCFLPDNFLQRLKYNITLIPMLRSDGTNITRKSMFVYSKDTRVTHVQQEFVAYIGEHVAIDE